MGKSVSRWRNTAAELKQRKQRERDDSHRNDVVKGEKSEENGEKNMSMNKEGNFFKKKRDGKQHKRSQWKEHKTRGDITNGYSIKGVEKCLRRKVGNSKKNACFHTFPEEED